MKFRNTRPSCEEARQIDIVSYLSSLGYEPSKIRSCNYWYLSPLRQEKTPSFKVNRKLNKWYDFGIRKGGSLIDFAILYNDCTVGEFLQTLNNNFSFHRPIKAVCDTSFAKTESRIIIVKEKPLTSFTLQRYLNQRRIPMDVAKQFCSEVIYSVKGKEYFAIGVKNNSGGYELRNTFFKGSSSPKDVTVITNSAKQIACFEGFFDFLSFMAIFQSTGQIQTDFIILNSVSFFERARPFMEQYEVINLYLDNDKTGLNCRENALSMSKKYKDKSELYKRYKDLNDWLVNVGKSQNLLSKSAE